MESKQLVINRDDSVSINDLVSAQANGTSVQRSAHVGNLSPYNLALADAGLPVLSVDHTITGVDRNYFPEFIGPRNQQAQVAPLGKLVCRTTMPDGSTNLDEYQMRSVVDAIPQAQLFTNTEYLQANESVVGEIVSLALAEFPRTFERIAMPDGSVTRQPMAASIVRHYGIMQLNDDPRAEQTAVIMPNIVNIMANFVVESLRTERAVQYHLSGPDMVRYIGNMIPDLQRLYGRLADNTSFGRQLPDFLAVQLVPTAEAKFATTVARQPQLDALVTSAQDAMSENVRLADERKQFFLSPSSRDPAVKAGYLASVYGRQTAAEKVVAERIAEVPELFNAPGELGFLTQYDVLAEGGLYVPAMNRDLSMAQLAQISAYMGAIRKRNRL